MERDCSHLVAQFQSPGGMAGESALRAFLAQPGSDTECLGKVLAGAGHREDVPILTQLMLKDPQATVRLHAATVLGYWNAGLLPIFKALSLDLRAEPDAAVAGARIASIGKLMRHARETPWNAETSILKVTESISHYWRPGSPTHDAEMMRLNPQRLQALASIAQVLALHYPNDPHAGDTRPGISAIRAAAASPSISAAIIDGVLRSLHMLPDVSRASALDLLADLAARDRLIGLPAQAWSSYMRILVPLLSHSSAPLRGRAAGAISAALLSQARHADDAWRDFSPVLASGVVDELNAALGAALDDEAAYVRRKAAAGLGAFMRFRPRYADALIGRLSDSDADVRASAALSLAQVPVLPPRAVGQLRAMVAQGDAEAEAALIALSNHNSPDVIATLIAALERRPVAGPDRQDLDFRPVRDISLTAHRALRKLGSVTVLPLLAHVPATTSTRNRDRLFATLEAIDWRHALAGIDSAQVVAALAPGLSAADPEVRVMALALLAMARPYAAHPYPDTLAELVIKTYMPLTSPGAQVQQSRSSTLYTTMGEPSSETHNHEWARDPVVSAVAIAGNSRSTAAARRMTDWMCTGRRLETDNVRNSSSTGEPGPDGQLDTIRASLGTMGASAAIPVIDALLKGASQYCFQTLLEALEDMDLDGSDTAVTARLIDTLDSKVAGVRLAGLYKLVHMPTLPEEARVRLRKLASGADKPEAQLASVLPARAVILPPSIFLFENPFAGSMVVAQGAALEQWKQAILDSLAEPPEADPNFELEQGIRKLKMVGLLGIEGRAAVPALIKAMQTLPALARETAATSLGLVAGPEALSALAAAASASPGSTLAQRAKVAAGRIRQRG